MKENDKYTYKRGAFFLVAAYFSFTNTINFGNIFGCLCITAIFFSPALIIKLLSTFTSNVYLFFFIFF